MTNQFCVTYIKVVFMDLNGIPFIIKEKSKANSQNCQKLFSTILHLRTVSVYSGKHKERCGALA